jgi:phage baseplate assembly protein W
MGKILLNNLPTSLLPAQNYLFADLHLDLNENYNNSNYLFQNSEVKDLKVDYDIDAIKNSLRNIFTTIPGEKILNPEFGMDLRKYLFEPATIEVAERIRSEIYIQIGKFEPRVKLNNVQITVYEDAGEFDIVIYFSIPSININNVSFFGTLNNNGYNYRS